MLLTVRFAKYGELERINELRRQVNELHVNGRPDIFRAGFCKELQTHIYDAYESDNCAVIAALYDNVVCGFATVIYMTKPESPYNIERKIYQVEEFGVDAEFRRHGIGTALVEFMKKDAAQKGFNRIELDMWAFNKTAKLFYEAAGFVEYRRYMELNVSGYPTAENAEKLLAQAEICNPGTWGSHSRVAGRCAKAIAEKCGMDPDKAYVLGLLHDIGRRFGISHFRHVYDGFTYMNELGYPQAAKICLTHSFSVQDISDYIGNFDVTPEQKDYIEKELAKCVYDDYDRLIQLCDAISMSTGAVKIEKRMNDVKRRYGAYPQKKWDKNLELKQYFEAKAGETIEQITEGITGE